MEELYRDITWSINEPPNYETIGTPGDEDELSENEIDNPEIDEETFNFLNSNLNFTSPSLILYYPISRYSEQLYPITYNLSGTSVTPLSLLKLIYDFYNTPLSEESFRKLGDFGESDSEIVNDIVQDALEDNEPLVAKDLLLNRVFFEGLSPYENGYEVLIGS